MREIARDPDRARPLVAQILGLRLVLVAIASILFLLVLRQIDQPELVKTVMVVQGAGLFVTVLTLDFVFQGLQRMRVIAFRQAAAAVLVLIAVLLLIRSPDDILFAAGIPVAMIAVSVAWLAILTHRRIIPLGIDFNPAAWRPILRASLPIVIAGIMGTIFLNIDIVMLGFLADQRQVGLYVGVSKIYVIALMVGGLISSAFSPALAAAWPKDEEMRTRYREFMSAVMFVGAPVAALGIAFPGEIITIIFGSEFIGAQAAMIILMIAVLFGHGCIVSDSALITWNDQTAQMVIYMVGAAVNVVLNLILIPRFGIEGAAMATLAAQLLILAGLMGRVWFKFHHAAILVGVSLAFCAAVAIGVVKGAGIAAGGALVPGPMVFDFAVKAAASGILYLGLATALKIIAPRRVIAAVMESYRRRG
jgi:O-antigen/teichoic acid export membrane protein